MQNPLTVCISRMSTWTRKYGRRTYNALPIRL